MLLTVELEQVSHDSILEDWDLPSYAKAMYALEPGVGIIGYELEMRWCDLIRLSSVEGIITSETRGPQCK
jgi:hypothetical protein